VSRDEYVTLLRELLSRDPERIREANRRLYSHVVDGSGKLPESREADLALAEVAG
jgi:hypothetical protein